MNTNEFGRIGIEYEKACQLISDNWTGINGSKDDQVLDLSPVLSVLKHCHLKEDYVFEAVPPEYDGMSVPYARNRYSNPLCPKRYPGIRSAEDLPDFYYTYEDVFDVEMSPEGVWEAFLLWELHRHLPSIQHGIYGRRDLLYDLDSYIDFAAIGDYIDKETGDPLEDEIKAHVKKYEGKNGYHQVRGYQTEYDLRKAVALRGCPLLLPSVDFGRHRVYVSGWCPWSGLHRETLKFKQLNKAYGFLSINTEFIANYWWGIMI